ncbi:MAG: phosphotransferase [Chloroflexi bacterium]|nr:phosphotransferase [Chloroflexota bacterium]
MLERPKLADEFIIARLEASYDLGISALAFLPVGNDARAWAYRVETATGDFYLKLRKGAVNRAALLVPQFLQERGIRNAVAPLRTAGGELFARFDDYALMLYPFIAGDSKWDMTLSTAQWREWGGIMREIHCAAIPADLARAIPEEVFGLKWLSKLARVEAVLERGDIAGAIAADVADLWRSEAALIDLCRERYLATGARLASQPPAFALCHADIHPANIIIDAANRIHIVDWDETLLAPKERDLMFFIDDGRPAHTTEAFLAGYGAAPVDPLALAYYKYDWVMQELADYGERIFLSDDIGGGDLALAGSEFARLFEPGDVIERAQRAYARFRISEGYGDANQD